MARFSVLDIPGYAEAVIQEQVLRDAAFLGLKESIAGFQVMPITVWHYIALRLARNSVFLQEETPSPEDLANFLWILSPQYRPESRILKWLFFSRCKRIFGPPKFLPLVNTRGAKARFNVRNRQRLINGARVLGEAKAYVAAAMQDRPPSKSINGFEPDYYSDGALFCSLFAREYRWSESEILRMPIKRMWQYLNEIRRNRNPKAILCNPSDVVMADWIRSRNQNRKEAN